MSRIKIFAYTKTKIQFSCAVTAQLISAFVFATWTEHFPTLLKAKVSNFFSGSTGQFVSDLVEPGPKPQRLFFLRRG